MTIDDFSELEKITDEAKFDKLESDMLKNIEKYEHGRRDQEFLKKLETTYNHYLKTLDKLGREEHGFLLKPISDFMENYKRQQE